MSQAFPFQFFMGVVESTDDPKNSGRVQVRIFGIHSEHTVANDQSGQGMPTSDLPWFQVGLPTTSSGVNGIGENHGLLSGSWVAGVSRDGPHFQDGIILVAVPGIPTEKNPNPTNPPAAFHGQDGKWPDPEFMGEPDSHSRVARGDLKYKDAKWKPSIQARKDELKKGIKTAGGGSWDEMDPAYGTTYGNSRVLFTKSGHTVEYDDTPGKERITVFHGPSHTYSDIHADGSIQERVHNKKYVIIDDDFNVYVGGALNITVEGNASLLVNGNLKSEVKGTADIKIDGNATVETKDLTATVSGDLEADVSGDSTLKTNNMTATIQGTLSATCNSANVQAQGTMTIQSAAALNLVSGVEITLLAPTINLSGTVI